MLLQENKLAALDAGVEIVKAAALAGAASIQRLDGRVVLQYVTDDLILTLVTAWPPWDAPEREPEPGGMPFMLDVHALPALIDRPRRGCTSWQKTASFAWLGELGECRSYRRGKWEHVLAHLHSAMVGKAPTATAH